MSVNTPRVKAILGFSLFFCVFNLQAALITYSGFTHVGSNDVDYIVTIKDDNELGVTTGKFQVNYEVADSSPNNVGKLTGFFFDLDDSYAASNLGLSNQSPGNCGSGFDTNAISGGGCNTTLQLGATAGAFQSYEFDVGIAWKNNNDEGSGSFEIAALGFLLNDWGAIGIRGQGVGVGEDDSGSAKEFQAMNDGTSVAAVPIPAAVWLFGSALLGLLGFKSFSFRFSKQNLGNAKPSFI